MRISSSLYNSSNVVVKRLVSDILDKIPSCSSHHRHTKSLQVCQLIARSSYNMIFYITMFYIIYKIYYIIYKIYYKIYIILYIYYIIYKILNITYLRTREYALCILFSVVLDSPRSFQSSLLQLPAWMTLGKKIWVPY